MQLSYQKKGNYTYAKDPGESYRENGRVKKRNAVYLGRVIDMDNNVFYNKERGVFTYDILTGTFGEADPAYQGSLKNDRRKNPNLILDFGDSYFVDSLIKTMHYDEVLNGIDYQNKDTLWAMLEYYILLSKANMHANTWYEGSFANVLYPKADIHSQRISKLLDTLGSEPVRRSYFKAHIAWLKKYICDDPAIIVDSTGLPNAIQMNMTQISNHNGKISNEARMITAVQRDSGYPIMFRTVPGNIVDVSTLSTTITTLAEYDVPTDLAMLDAGYVSEDNIAELFSADIEFVARLPEKNHNIYNDVLSKGLKTLKRPENLVEFNGRYVYAKQVECQIGGHTAYAYLCFDVDASSDENHKAIKRSRKKKISDSEMHVDFEDFHDMLLAEVPIIDRAHTQEELRKMLQFVHAKQQTNPSYLAPYAFELQMIIGCRRGEIPPLAWKDIQNNMLLIYQEQLTRKRNGGVEKESFLIVRHTKTGQSRGFPITEELAEYLQRLRAMHDRYYPHSHYLFPADTPNGVITNNVVYNFYRRMCRKLGISISKQAIKGTHSLRRNAITDTLIASNGDIELAASLCGNSPEVIRDHYNLGADIQRKREVLEKCAEIRKARESFTFEKMKQ